MNNPFDKLRINMKEILIKIYLGYLRFFAKIQLRKINPIIIGIGGASGKSSVSHLVSLVLSEKYKVKESRGKNSESGIPLNILGIELKSYGTIDWVKAAIIAPFKIITNWERYDYYVVEMGIDSPYPPKNMSYLLTIVKPKIGVLTNINLEHSVYFEPLARNQEEVERKQEILELTAKEEQLLLKSIDESGRSIVNLDDTNIKKILPLKSKTVTISAKDKDADFYIVSYKIENNSFTVKFIFLNDEYAVVIPQVLPKYFTTTIVIALATAFSCGVNIKDGINLIQSKFNLPAGRFSVFKGIKNTTIFDSSYNSSLEAVAGALQTLKEIGESQRKVGILGDMRELGTLSRIQHELLAREILKTLDFVILIGSLMNEFVAPILEKENFSFISFDSFKKAKESILESVKKDDVILVKGSQNTLFLERVVEILLADKSDKDKLCRRGSFWDKMRKVAL